MNVKDFTQGTEDAVRNAISSAMRQIGRGGLHAMSPDLIEYYMCSLELIDSANNRAAYMSFAVLPNSIVETKNSIMNIVKTNKGIVNTFCSDFVPRDIQISGTFGKKIRILLGQKDIGNKFGENKFFDTGNIGISVFSGDVLVKTGYGLIKMLKNIIDASHSLDASNKPYRLIFHNEVLNTHYYVEAMQYSFSMSVENNMIWQYNLAMKAVAEIDISSVPIKSRLTDIYAASMSNVVTNLLTKAMKISNNF